jgi:hypothetical protein
MVESYFYERETGCETCPSILIKRTILVDLQEKTNIAYLKSTRANREQLVEFKALSHRSGHTRQYNVKRVGTIGSSSRIGQAAQAAGSILLPGNISPYRSPIRSAISRALTPGKPGRRRASRGGRTSRCPEGYQYGGRFTDNRLSTCGQKLFDIPGPLGAAIGAIRRALRRQSNITVNPVEGDTIRGTGRTTSPVVTRKPQIPRVTKTTNVAARKKSVDEMIKGISDTDSEVTRLVRRDGYVLEPVVSAGVLRTIPDNRDMEDATYLMRLNSVGNMGKDELGLLSNTGVTNVTYVLDDGAFVEVKKVRPLTVGERRKLGRTVNKAIDTDNKKDPAARLKYLVNETGDGMEYSEKLPKGKTLADLLSGAKKKRSVEKTPKGAPKESEMSLDSAIAAIKKGEPLSSIPPSLLQQALTEANAFKRRGKTYQSAAGRLYEVRKGSPESNLNASLSAAVQKFLGLDAPDVGIVGAGDSKRLMVELPDSVVDKGRLDGDSLFKDLSPADVAKLMVADMLSDVSKRPESRVAIVKAGDSLKPVPLTVDSELTDLSNIKIRERTKAQIRKFQSVSSSGLYSKYYRELKDEQKRQMQEQVSLLLEKARKFNYTKYRDALYRDGQLTQAEKTHLNIVGKIIENRIAVLKSQREQIMQALGGKK